MVDLKKPLFNPGRVCATPAALQALQQANQNLWVFLARHLAGDYGEVDAHDKAANDEALKDGNRLLSAYTLSTGTTIWLVNVIAEEKWTYAIRNIVAYARFLAKELMGVSLTVTYRYSGTVNVALPWTPALLEIKEKIEAIQGEYNYCLLNRYRSGQDSMGWHADDEPEMGNVIGSLSLGATRTFRIKHNKSKETRSFPAGNGTLMICFTRSGTDPGQSFETVSSSGNGNRG